MANIQIPIVEISSNEGATLLKELESARSDRNESVENSVRDIIDNVRKDGDTALFELTNKFENRVIDSSSVRLSEEIIHEQAKKIDPKLAEAIKRAAANIRAYHEKQKVDATFTLETKEGTLSQLIFPLKRVGLYVPGGYTVYPSTILMNGIPAQIAGVEEIVAVTPCKDSVIAPELAFVFELIGIKEVYQIGGAQAIAALAYGTETIKAVDKIVGPGNSYVATAKKMVYGAVDIDSVAGPSEIAILVDNKANPNWVALDLLSQAEHGSGDETAVLVTEDRAYADKVVQALHEEIEKSPVKEIFEKLSPNAISIFIGKDREESIAFVNELGPEHLEIQTENYKEDLKLIYNAAAIFLGYYTPVAMGDYYVGTNHVLPTAAASRYASPLGVDSFIKRVSVAEVTEEGLKGCAEDVSLFARSEKFVHHALSVERRVGIEK